MGTKIVLADDEPDLRAIYAACLRKVGYQVHEAADGREAVALVVAHRPALLILDVWMPHLNGFEVLDELREDPLATNLKVVMLSNLGDSDTRLEGYAVGVVDYWLKSLLSLNELQRRVRDVLAEIESEAPMASELS
ncbi:MAG: response regulator [Planctomycetaceae bacterium]|nr:response regulator [Planctomycetaceae bacterium]MBV8269760.1 response regulator [Planctomycetaceae bacterium]MBV8381190.1 response regulator [Planctomycetaceae bacterium]MBV8553966.1 response regulator [Planctomycetaceae bacterium]MBV8677287.1 response regulator [Planctomycetaceae bacterium]